MKNYLEQKLSSTKMDYKKLDLLDFDDDEEIDVHNPHFQG